MEVEQPVACRDCASFHFHTTLPGMLGATLIWDQIVQVGEPREKRLLAPFGMMEAFHREQFPLDGVMGLIQQGAGHGHLRVCEDRIPARLLLLEPAPDALAVGCPRRFAATRSAKWRSRCPSANTRKPLRWRARYSRVWNWERKALRTGDAIATSLAGSLLIAWRRQLPRRAPGNSVRILLVVLSKPSVRMPRTRYDGSCWSAAC